MANNTGLSPNNPSKYLGANVYLSQVVTRNRAPTGADYRQPETGKLYPFGTFWLVGKDPTTGTFGDLWYLSKIVSNVGNWELMSTGTSGAILGIDVDNNIAPGTDPVLPNGSGIVRLTGAQVTNAGFGNVINVKSVSANTVTLQIQQAGSSPAANINKNGVSHYDSDQFSVDPFTGFVQLVGGGAPAAVSFPTDSGTAVPSASGVINLFGQNTAGSGITTSASGNTVSHRMLTPYSLGAFLFDGGDLSASRSNSGGSVIFNTHNTSNTASSHARIDVQVAGASAGNAWIDFTVSGIQSFAAGIDNADDKFKITNSNTFMGAGSTLLQIDTSGNVAVLTGDFIVTRSGNGVAITNILWNTSNTANSGANFQARVAGGTADDPYYRAAVDGVGEWSFGLDNSDSDAFKLSWSATLGTNDYLKMSTVGQQNLPLQSAFSAQLSVSQANVTGDGTVATLVCDNELYDQHLEYDNTTGIITCKQTGRYTFNVTICLGDIDVGHTSGAVILTIGGAPLSVALWRGNPAAIRDANNNVVISGSFSMTMTATDTAFVTVQVSGGAKTVDLVGNPSNTPLYCAFSANMFA